MPMHQHQVDEGTMGYEDSDKGCFCSVDIMTQSITSTKTGNVYIPIRKISNGNFSTVYVAYDETNNQYCAMKICKHDTSYDKYFVDECEILEQIKNDLADKDDDGKCIQIYDWFFYKYTSFLDDGTEQLYQHCCIITELLGHSALKLLRRYRCRANMSVGMPIPVVKTITKSVLLQLKHLHEVGYMHTDIKPENIVLKYFLPEIEYDANYKLPDLLFGRQSRHLFDSKLSTPAVKITQQDFNQLENSDYQDIKDYIHSIGHRKGYDTLDECMRNVVIYTDYKQMMKQFMENHEVNKLDAKHSYKISGVNIFNVQNLMREAEKIFRLATTAENDWINLQSLYISNFLNNSMDISDQQLLTESTISSPPDQGQTQKMSQVVTESQHRTQNTNKLQESLDFISTRCALKQLKKASAHTVTYTYKLIDFSQINPENTIITTEQGIKINVSRIKPLTVDIQSVYAEKLYYHESQPQTIKQLSSSGLHSRFALIRYMQDNGIGNHQYNLPKIYHSDQLKCFGMTKDMRVAYPVMINYFRKGSLIPFCEEMFKTRIIDLGNAERIEEHYNGLVQTRNYRAPEVICGCVHDEKIDIFSVGCVVFELLTGDPLFVMRNKTDTQKDINQLRQITKLMGNDGLDGLLESGNPEQCEMLKNQHISSKNRVPMSTVLVQRYNIPKKDAVEVMDFIEPLLRLDPRKRVSAAEALQHPWLSNVGQGDLLITPGTKDIR